MSQNSIPHSMKSEIKETVSLSIPLVLSQLIYASSGFIGTALIARLGEDALAASVLVSTIWMTLIVLFFGILNSISVLVAHQYGAKNYRAISEIMGQSYLLGILTMIVMILMLLAMPLLLNFSAQSVAVLKLAHQYMYALIWTVPGLVVLIINEQFLAGANHTKLVLRISMIVVPIEIPLIYALIFGKFGLPACGVAGIGYGFAITYSITAIGLSLYLLKSKYFQKYQLFSRINQINMVYLKELIQVGLPMGFMHVVEVSTFAVVTLWIGHFGTTFLAAHQIIMQYLGFAITLVFAVSQAVTIRVGHAVGREDLSGVYYASYIGMILNLMCVLIIALAFYFIPTFFLRLDIDIHNPENARLLRDASALLLIGGVLLIFDNFRIIGFGALRGLKDTRFPMYASIISFWLIGLSTAYVLSFIFHWQAAGIWWGLTIGIATGAVIVHIRLQRLLQRVDLKKLAQIKSVAH